MIFLLNGFNIYIICRVVDLSCSELFDQLVICGLTLKTEFTWVGRVGEGIDILVHTHYRCS